MPQQLDVEKDPFLLLLTDALRAGPGSPQWHEAVAQLKTSTEPVDEYKLLLEAREALESGKDYRSVRAGPGFTRRLNDQLDRPQPRSPRIHPASLIAIVAIVAVVAAIGVTIYKLYPRPVSDDSSRQIEELATTFISDEVTSSTFEDGIPAAWRTIGSLPLAASGGLKAGPASVPDGGYIGGGIVLNDSLRGAQAIAVQATLHVSHSDEGLIPQVFVSTDSEFSADRAVSAHENSHELVWQLKGDLQNVVVDGRITRQASINLKAPSHIVRLILKGDLAIVECDGRRLWSGHSAQDDSPRYIGVRFLRKGGKNAADASIQSVRVLTTNG